MGNDQSKIHTITTEPLKKDVLQITSRKLPDFTFVTFNETFSLLRQLV